MCSPVTTESHLSHLTVPSLQQIVSLIESTKSCSSLDPLPLIILHQITTVLAPSLLKICSRSIIIGCVPDDFKKSILTPIIKKSNLDSLVTSNYRSISNLSIHSKTLERIVASQLTTYLDNNNILHPLQSAHTPRKSTETALTKISSDLLTELDNKNGTILILLDMSAAFDTLDHNVLIHHLLSIGITGTALDWFKSYLNGRTSSVYINNQYSLPCLLHMVFLKDPSLGPFYLTFTFYHSSKPLRNMKAYRSTHTPMIFSYT